MNDRTLGTLYAVSAVMFLSTAFVLIKKLLEFTDLFSLIFQYFAISTAALFLVILAKKDIKFFSKAKGELKSALIISVFGIVTAVLFQLSIKLLSPSFFAFVMRLSILTALLLGIVFLKERFTRVEAFGALAAFIGTLILTYAPGRFAFSSIAVGIAASVIIGFQDFTWKLLVRKTHPITINFYRTLAIVVSVGIYLALTGSFRPLPFSTYPLLFLAGLLSPVFGVVSFLAAMSKLEVSKVVTIRTLEPFVVVIYALFFFGTFPSMQELLGGSLIVAGVATVTIYHRIIGVSKSPAHEG